MCLLALQVVYPPKFCGARLRRASVTNYKIMRLLGIDYGMKRVGIALSDETGKFALPHAVWENDDDLISKINTLCGEKNISVIIIGESRNLDGSENEILKEIKLFKITLERNVSIPVYFEPEFYTSAQAARLQGKNIMHDASAAALILKSYLDRHTTKKN